MDADESSALRYGGAFVVLSADLQHGLEGLVKAGAFESVEQAVEEALRRLIAEPLLCAEAEGGSESPLQEVVRLWRECTARQESEQVQRRREALPERARETFRLMEEGLAIHRQKLAAGAAAVTRKQQLGPGLRESPERLRKLKLPTPNDAE